MADNVLTEDEQVVMLQALHRMTDEAEVEWQREDPPVRSDRRILITPDRLFKFVLQSADRDGERPYELIVNRSKGNGIYGRFTSIQMMAVDEGGDSTINDLIADLYSKAHKRQPSEEVVVKALFNALKSPGSNPKDSQS
jgi:hypothetical protein